METSMRDSIVVLLGDHIFTCMWTTVAINIDTLVSNPLEHSPNPLSRHHEGFDDHKRSR